VCVAGKGKVTENDRKIITPLIYGLSEKLAMCVSSKGKTVNKENITAQKMKSKFQYSNLLCKIPTIRYEHSLIHAPASSNLKLRKHEQLRISSNTYLFPNLFTSAISNIPFDK